MRRDNSTYRFDLVNDGNHPLVPLGGVRYFLDTGSPRTYRHPRGPARVSILGRKLTLRSVPSAPGVLEAGSDLLDFHFDVLLGMDLMSELAWRLDWSTRTAEAALHLADESNTTWVGMPPSLRMASSCPTCRVNKGLEVALLDTGARLSYRVGDPPATARLVGRTYDFNPFLGMFVTPVWEDHLEVGGYLIPIRFGQVPEPAPALFEAMGAKWILGSDLLRAFRVTFDFPGRRLGLKTR